MNSFPDNSRPMPRAVAIPAQTQAAMRVVWMRFVWALALGLAFLIAQALSAQAQNPPGSFADLVDEVSPAVVNITTTTTLPGRMQDAPLPNGTPFDDFFRDFFDDEAPQEPRRGEALGSGFLISPEGYIVTNNHVIEGADEIRVELFTGLRLTAELLGTDPLTDIALLKVEHEGDLPHVVFGDSEAARVGDWVLAMGNPLGQGFSVSAGIISARGRALAGAYDDYIQTDAAINRGNSGGPLFNMAGEVIGVNTAILSPTGGNIGIGFAMSSEVVTRVVDQLIEFGETFRGWLGVTIQDVTEEIAESIDLAEARGALVADVPEGPALDAGVLVGDVILGFNGVDVIDVRDLVSRVGAAEVGAEAELVIFRDGEMITLPVTLGRRETAGSAPTQPAVPDEQPEPEVGPGGSLDLMGMTLAPLDDALREELGLPAAAPGIVIIDVAEDSEAWIRGLRAGDLITDVNLRPVESLSDFEQHVQESLDAGRASVLLLVRRDTSSQYVTMPLED